MYPEIRLIGRIDKVEDNSPNPYERTISLQVKFRNGVHGAFRVRTPLGDEYGLCPGDEVFVCGELDEFGTIHPHRLGFIRKLAPVLAKPKLSTTQSDAQKTAKESENVFSSPNSSLNQDSISQSKTQSESQSASTPIPRPISFLFKGNARLGNGNRKGTPPHLSPVSTTQPEHEPKTQPTATTNAAIRSFTRTNNLLSESNAPQKPTPPTSSIFTKSNASRPALENNRPPKKETAQSDLAEYIQNEIPW